MLIKNNINSITTRKSRFRSRSRDKTGRITRRSRSRSRDRTDRITRRSRSRSRDRTDRITRRSRSRSKDRTNRITEEENRFNNFNEVINFIKKCN